MIISKLIFNITILCCSPTKVSNSCHPHFGEREREREPVGCVCHQFTFSWDREILQPLQLKWVILLYEVLLSHLLVFAISAFVTCPLFKLLQETLLSFLCVLVLCIQVRSSFLNLGYSFFFLVLLLEGYRIHQSSGIVIF